jgi:hypothetical protein
MLFYLTHQLRVDAAVGVGEDEQLVPPVLHTVQVVYLLYYIILHYITLYYVMWFVYVVCSNPIARHDIVSLVSVCGPFEYLKRYDHVIRTR